MDAPEGERAADPSDGAPGSDSQDAGVVVDVLHRVGRCSMRALQTQPEIEQWSPVRLEQAVVRAWNGGLVFIDPNDDLVAL